MQGMVKAVFFDIDGTLVSFRTHRIPDSTAEALAALKERGIRIFIATGRSGLLMKEIGGLDAGIFDGLITFNGQHCRVGGEVIHTHPIPAGDVAGGIGFFGENDISCLFEGTDFVAVNSHDSNALEIADLLSMRLPAPSDLREIKDKEIIQLIFFGDVRQEEELLKVMPSCVSTRWHPLFTDIIPSGGGKHVGMEKALARFGLTREESMAFGDGGNDISMLRYAGIGVAMDNASDNVKAAADYVTTGVDDDGVANALRHFGIL